MSGSGRGLFSGRLSPPGPNQSLKRAKEKCEGCSQRTVFCETDSDVPPESLMTNYHHSGGAGTVFNEGVVWSLIAIFFYFLMRIVFLMDKFKMDY